MERQVVIDSIATIETGNYNTAVIVQTVFNTLLDYTDDGIEANAAEIGANTEMIETLTTAVNTLNDDVASHNSKIVELDNWVSDQQGQIDYLNSLEQNSFFQYSSPSAIPDSTSKLRLWYSFRGSKDKYVNYTFCMQATADITADPSQPFSFALDNPALMTILEGILPSFPSRRLAFVVPSNNAGKDYTKLYTATFELDRVDNKILHRFYPYNIIEVDAGMATQEIFKTGDEIFTSQMLHSAAFPF
jgi:hypothetical protein